jgi:hypothetical protein
LIDAGMPLEKLRHAPARQFGAYQHPGRVESSIGAKKIATG